MVLEDMEANETMVINFKCQKLILINQQTLSFLKTVQLISVI